MVYGFRTYDDNGNTLMDVTSTVTIHRGTYVAIPAAGSTHMFVTMPGFTATANQMINTSKFVGVEKVAGGVWLSAPIRPGASITFDGGTSYVLVWLEVKQ